MTPSNTGQGAERREIPTLPPIRTLNGKFDGYCHTCWNPVYRYWVSDDDPAGRCQFGASKATDCPDAMARARNDAIFHELADLIRQDKADTDRRAPSPPDPAGGERT